MWPGNQLGRLDALTLMFMMPTIVSTTPTATSRANTGMIHFLGTAGIYDNSVCRRRIRAEAWRAPHRQRPFVVVARSTVVGRRALRGRFRRSGHDRDHHVGRED